MTVRGKNHYAVMDDKPYCVAELKQLPGRRFYRAHQRFGVAHRFKYQGLTKFPKKYSQTFIAKGNMTTSVYIQPGMPPKARPPVFE